MLKLNNTQQQPSLVVYNASQPGSETGRRFIVPVTNPEADLAPITRRVCKLANASGSRVQFIGLCSEAMHELEFRRLLATVSAMMNYSNVSAESVILLGRNWLETLRSHVQAGDVIVYWNEQSSKLLHVDLGVPVYVIPELKPRKASRSTWVTQAAAWIGSIAIIVLFFFMQVQIEHFAQGWATIMELLSVAGEFGLIWFWNNVLG